MLCSLRYRNRHKIAHKEGEENEEYGTKKEGREERKKVQPSLPSLAPTTQVVGIINYYYLMLGANENNFIIDDLAGGGDG
jgi:hypothetical protein